jgi:hypothetical protein
VDAKKMVTIKNAVIKDARNAEELMELFRKGNAERHVGATKMNAESSRSHSIFAVMAETYDSTTKKTVMGKLSLVDLAGSERADKTGAGYALLSFPLLSLLPSLFLFPLTSSGSAFLSSSQC